MDGGGILVVSIYVDDIVYTVNDQEMMQTFKVDMMQKYEMSDSGLLHHFLGMKIIQTKSTFSFIKENMQLFYLTNLDCKIAKL